MFTAYRICDLRYSSRNVHQRSRPPDNGLRTGPAFVERPEVYPQPNSFFLILCTRSTDRTSVIFYVPVCPGGKFPGQTVFLLSVFIAVTVGAALVIAVRAITIFFFLCFGILIFLVCHTVFVSFFALFAVPVVVLDMCISSCSSLFCKCSVEPSVSFTELVCQK